MNDPGLFEAVANWQPDAFLVAGWYHLIPKRWRALAPAYGLHASLLPDYSGGAPLVWAMIHGEEKTGITLFQMDDGIDSGSIAAQGDVPIHADDTIATLYARVEQHTVELLHAALPKLARGALKLQPQDETKRRIMPQRSPEDGLIDWNQEAVSIDRFIRAQTRPYPGAFTTLNGKPLRIWRATVMPTSKDPLHIARVCLTNANIYAVGCRQDAMTLHEVSYERHTYTQPRLTELFGGGGSGWAHR